MDKPSDIFAREVEWRALGRFVGSHAPEPTLGVVSGRRRQGKTYLLQALTRQTGGFYFAAEEATERESLAQFGQALSDYLGTPGTFVFASWREALDQLFAHTSGRTVVIDEFPYLIKSSSALPSAIQHQIDAREHRAEATRTRLILCGSALSVMGELLGGTAPLRGRASLELVIHPFDYRTAARFWNADDPRLAARLHAIVGGTPAYRTRYVDHEEPRSLAEFDEWVVQHVLSDQSPLYREARYLISSEGGIRDASLYHAVLGAIAAGKNTRSAIASYCGRQSSDITHQLAVLEDCGLLRTESDAFRPRRQLFRVNEPLVRFYESVMRPMWSRLELGQAHAVWRDSAATFSSRVLGPHFEHICRTFTQSVDRFGGVPAHVSSGIVSDPANRTSIEVDVAATSAAEPSKPALAMALGEAKWGTVMDLDHLARLERARELLIAKRVATANTALVCFSAAGHSTDLIRAAAEDSRVHLIGLDELYG